MNYRFAAAMAAYAILALLGGIALTGNVRTMLWIVLGALAVKTIIVVAREKYEKEND